MPPVSVSPHDNSPPTTLVRGGVDTGRPISTPVVANFTPRAMHSCPRGRLAAIVQLRSRAARSSSSR